MCLLSVVGKGYGRILINLVRKKVDGLISDDQDNFRPSKVCVDQAFVLTQLVEKTCGQYCMVLFFWWHWVDAILIFVGKLWR